MFKRTLTVLFLLCSVVFSVSAISSRYVYNTLSEKDRKWPGIKDTFKF